MELTDRRAKPAVYFGGKSRIIDFALSNALNSGIRRIAVATQYKAHSLIRHLQRGWNFLQPVRNESFDILPASQRVAEDQWYAGTADAVFQNIDIIDGYEPEYIIILAGDHIYKMDYERMLVQHVNAGADVTVACLEVPVAEATALRRHARRRDTTASSSFVEKPPEPPEMPDRPGWALASMGIYVFNREFLHEQLRRDAADPKSSRDFGRDIIPWLVKQRQGDRAPLHRVLRQVARRGRRLLARRRHARRLLGSQHRPDRRRSRARSLRSRLADLDLRRDHAAGEIRARRRRTPRRRHLVARLGRLHRLGRARSGARCSSPACTCTRTAASRTRSCLPYVEIGAARRLTNAIVDAGVKIPDGPRGRRRSRARRAAIPPHRARHLPHHAADDRSAAARELRHGRAMPCLTVQARCAACTSSRSHRRSFRWSRPAASPTSSARCRRRSRAKTSRRAR